MRGVLIAGLAFVALALATACGGGNGPSKATPNHTAQLATISAGLNAPKSLTPTPLIADQGVRVCQATDLASTVRTNSFTNGGLVLDISLGNRSSTPCQISRVPGVQFLGPAGDEVPIETSLGDGIFEQPLLLSPNLGSFDPLGAIKPGQIRIGMSWHIHNGAGTCPTPPPEGDIVRLRLPGGGGDLDVDVSKSLSYGGAQHGIQPCDGMVDIPRYGPY